MMYGFDYLGGAKYADVVLRNHPAGWAAGFFLSEFGDARGVIKKLLATGRCPRLRVQILWTNHTYDARRDDPKIVDGIKWLNRLKVLYPNVEIQASPICEHNIRGAQLRSLFAKCARTAQNVVLVNNPWQGDLLPGAINETHNCERALSGVYNFSYDGVACVDSDVEAIKRKHMGAQTFYWWDARFNGKGEPGDKVPISQRKNWPDAKLIDSIVYLRQDKGACELPRNWIWKSHSENKGTSDPRAEKPVCISPVKADKIDLIAANGQVVGSLRYYGVYENRFRYYASEWGYQLADKAKRIQNGDPVVSVRIGRKVYGKVNPAYRQNDYRNKG